MGVVKLTERVASPFAGSTVDRAAGVIRNVLVCGTDSANGRRYPWGAGLKGSIGLYEGRPVNCDHGSAATVDRRLGWLSAPRPGEDGRPRADLHVLKSHPMAERAFEAAERNAALFGLSHVAMCKTRREGGVDVVESIESVESVDLVADPATTKGLFESKGGRAVPQTVKEYLDKLAPRCGIDQLVRLRRLVREDDMAGAPMVADAPPADDAGTDADGGITAAFESAIMAIVKKALEDGVDKKAILKKIGKLLDGHADATDDGAGGEPDGDGDGYEEESKKSAANLTREAIEVCRKVGFRGFDADDLDAIASVPAARREALAKRLMGTDAGTGGGEKPTSGGRHQFAEHTDEKAAAQKVAEGKGGGGGGKADELPWLT